jgi:hypothetical protein
MDFLRIAILLQDLCQLIFIRHPEALGATRRASHAGLARHAHERSDLG